MIMFFVALGSVTYAQDSTRAFKELQGKKIGVVLSGGGAKGLAHIGVLKVLEEHDVKIDYITGTSMGAIIGGLYASGYSANQLDSIFKSADFNAIVKDFIPRSSKSVFEKYNDERYVLTLPFNNYRVGFPQALSKGMYNYNLITRLTHHVRHVRNFEELPIPFFCIATDIETSEQVVLQEGFLPEAILASGAFPSLYAPVEIDGRLLVDGGVVNNYPVDLLKERGIDYVIGVDVQDHLKDRTELRDAMKILLQISNFEMVKKMDAARLNTDLYIQPNIKGYNVVSFDAGDKIILQGEKAARDFVSELELLPKSSNINIKTNPTKETDSIYVTGIRTSSTESYTRSYLIGKLGFKQDQKVSYKDIRTGIERLNATQNFSQLSYEFLDGEDGDILNLRVRENEVRRFIRLGMHYDGLYKTSVLLNFTNKKTFFNNDVFSFDFVLGDNIRYVMDYYVDNGFNWTIGFKSKFTQFNRNIDYNFENRPQLSPFIQSINVDFRDWTQQFYIQNRFLQKFTGRVGTEIVHQDIISKTLDQNSSISDNSTYVNLFGYFRLDSFDDKFFPKNGGNFNIEAKTFLYASNQPNFADFSFINADFSLVRNYFKNFTLRVDTEVGFSFGEGDYEFFNYMLGGYGFQKFNNAKYFYGYDFLSIVGNSYIKGAITFDWEFYRKNHINLSANYAQVGYDIFLDTKKWINQSPYSGYAVGYGIESFLGPIEIKHNWSPETKDHFTWFSVGFWF